MVWRLDRPGRALKDLIARAEALRIQGVGLKSLKEAIDTDSACSGAAFVRAQQVFGYTPSLADNRNQVPLRSIFATSGLFRSPTRPFGWIQLPITYAQHPGPVAVRPKHCDCL